MDLSRIPLFALADRRLAWVAARQSVLAQNIANADTPGWRAQDVTPFGATLAPAGINLAMTAAGHIAGRPANAVGVAPVASERSPDGNSVALDKELAKVADTDSAHEVAIGLTKTYLGMFRTTIGK